MIKEIHIHKCHLGTFGIRSDIVDTIKRHRGSLVAVLEDKGVTRVIPWDKLDSEKLQELPGQPSKYGKPYKLFMYNAKDYTKEYEQGRLF